MRQFFFILLLIFCISIQPVCAQSDDITQMGSVSPLFYLENAFRKDVKTSEGETLSVEISSIAVEAERILIRFFVSDLSDGWKEKITDDLRLYGSYLPSAEILTDDGSFLTPSSASRYSFLEYNERLIIGGLMIFQSDSKPQSFYLNFNQIPFDTQPLSEGFTEPVVLKSAQSSVSGSVGNLTDTHNGLTFTLAASAQTRAVSMLQPAVRIERADESLSKFGWITIADNADGKRYTVTRGNLYGFNLADDTEYSPAHAYVFAPVPAETQISVSMDHAYIFRKFDPVKQAEIDLTGAAQTVLLEDDDFYLKVTAVESVPDEDRIRLWIDRGGSQISDISFQFRGLLGLQQPSVNCGIDPESENFACDLYFTDISFPVNILSAEIEAVEYCKEGPWTLAWNPVPMSESGAESGTDRSAAFPYVSKYPFDIARSEDVQTVLRSIEERTAQLLREPGWIHESYELDYQFTDTVDMPLIAVDQYGNYLTHYITDNWYHVGEKAEVREIISIVRNPETKEIYSAQWQKSDSTIDLLHALKTVSNEMVDLSYSCFADFRNICESSAEFLSREPCADRDEGTYCLSFIQSLTGLPDAANSQRTVFEVSKQDHFILRETIQYERRSLNLIKDTLALEKLDAPADDIMELIDSIK